MTAFNPGTVMLSAAEFNVVSAVLSTLRAVPRVVVACVPVISEPEDPPLLCFGFTGKVTATLDEPGGSWGVGARMDGAANSGTESVSPSNLCLRDGRDEASEGEGALVFGADLDCPICACSSRLSPSTESIELFEAGSFDLDLLYHGGISATLVNHNLWRKYGSLREKSEVTSRRYSGLCG